MKRMLIMAAFSAAALMFAAAPASADPGGKGKGSREMAGKGGKKAKQGLERMRKLMEQHRERAGDRCQERDDIGRKARFMELLKNHPKARERFIENHPNARERFQKRREHRRENVQKRRGKNPGWGDGRGCGKDDRPGRGDGDRPGIGRGDGRGEGRGEGMGQGRGQGQGMGQGQGRGQSRGAGRGGRR